LSAIIEPSTAASLLVAAQEGRPEAWSRFVHLYGPLIYRWVRRSGLQSSDAADVTQDVLLSVSNDLPRFDPGQVGSKFRAWLWTITRRRIVDWRRGRPPELAMGSSIMATAVAASQDCSAESKWGELSDIPPTDSRIDTQTLLRRAVAIYRDRFDSKSWQAFWATVVEGRQPDEVAQTLGVSRWNVYKSRARILQRLRTELAGLLDDEPPR
jgi:RNA polymerase sigma-70 factor (ECF subfamily)